MTDLMPCPERFETVQKGDILPEIREEPETRGCDEVGDAEQNDSENRHQKEQAQEAQKSPTKVVHSLAQHEGPKRV